MNYPFENNKKGHPILDTEEKLQWYMNRLLHREVDLYEVCASVVDLETVLLEPRPNEYAQQIAMIRYGASPTLREPLNYGRVDRAVVPVLREIHARRYAELAQRSKELGEKERELRNEIIETEKEVKKEIRRWYEYLAHVFLTRKEQDND